MCSRNADRGSVALHRLFTSGHFSFQGGYTEAHSFALDGLASLRESLADLENSISQWEAVQREMRNFESRLQQSISANHMVVR